MKEDSNKVGAGQVIGIGALAIAVLWFGGGFLIHTYVINSPENMTWAIESGLKAIDDGHYDDAIRWFDAAGTDPSEGGYYNLVRRAALGKAAALIRQNKGKQAEEVLATAYFGKGEPDYKPLLELWSKALEIQGRGAEAGVLAKDAEAVAGLSTLSGSKDYRVAFIDADIADQCYALGQWIGPVSIYESAVKTCGPFEQSLAGGSTSLDDASYGPKLVRLHTRLAELYEKHYSGMPGYADKAREQRHEAEVLDQALGNGGSRRSY